MFHNSSRQHGCKPVFHLHYRCTVHGVQCDSRFPALPAVRSPATQRLLQREEEVVEHDACIVGSFRRETVHEAPAPVVDAALKRADGGERPSRLSRWHRRLPGRKGGRAGRGREGRMMDGRWKKIEAGCGRGRRRNASIIG